MVFLGVVVPSSGESGRQHLKYMHSGYRCAVAN
jgi:hypothetical protein